MLTHSQPERKSQDHLGIFVNCSQFVAIKFFLDHVEINLIQIIDFYTQYYSLKGTNWKRQLKKKTSTNE